MNKKLRSHLLEMARERQNKIDPSHDINHVIRVLALAEKIAKKEKADLDIVVPAACFHDIIVYRKDSPESQHETDDSAELAGELLKNLPGYPAEKIADVQTAIRQCSFSKGIVPDLLEAKVLQDADGLEGTGAIAIMRTFSSGGQMNRPFYDPEDPFCKNGDTVRHSSDMELFYRRLLVHESRMHTETARKIAKHRTKFLYAFLRQLKKELKESGVKTD